MTDVLSTGATEVGPATPQPPQRSLVPAVRPVALAPVPLVRAGAVGTRPAPGAPRPTVPSRPPRSAQAAERPETRGPAAAPVPAVAASAGWRPRLRSFVACLAVMALYSVWSFQPDVTSFNWALTAVWSLPVVGTLVGLQGALLLRRRVKHAQDRLPAPVSVPEPLLVVVPTIGRLDTYPALERAVRSFVHFLPPLFPALRVDVVVEEGCAAGRAVHALAERYPRVRVVTVPRGYATPNGTRFKARANQYAADLRAAEGEARPDVWVLHMDDDTGVGPDTAVALAQFVDHQRAAGEHGKHLAQGILAYPRENAANWFTWMADAVRPADDVTRFRALTGAGTPLAGLHGELLLVRAGVEAQIGWDFGPGSIVEDAEFALRFCERFPGGSDWFNGRCYGASPVTVRDFLRQRERWAWGLVGLVTARRIPVRYRAFMAWSVLTWVFGPLQHVGVVLAAGWLIGAPSASPVAEPVLVLWSLNFAFVVWSYWEGLRLNADSSRFTGRRWWEAVLVVLLVPVFGFLEGVGALRGLLKFLTRRENAFVVIAKPV